MDDRKDFYSPDEVAELLDLHVKTVRRFIREGKLNAARIGKQYRVALSDLNAFVGSEEMEPSTSTSNRRRRVIVSATVDIEAISREETDRITMMLTSAFNTAQESSSRKRLDCIYYEEQGKLRIVVNAELEFTSAVLSMVNSLLIDGRDS